MKLRQARPVLSNNATIHPYGWTEYKVLQNPEDFPRPSYHKIDNSKGENKHGYGISTNAAKSVKSAINMMEWLADEKPLFPDDPKCDIFWKLNLLTLTLPCKQIHSDKEMKKLLLDPFLKSCKYHFSLNLYFWKDEVQDNDNLHFHITTDTYMDKDQVRSLWNHQLDKYGYIDRYRQNQLEKHRDGFYYDKSQYKINFKDGNRQTIHHSTQKAAYIKGTAENWSNPNTTDIHPIHSVDNLSAYMVAYLSKKDIWKKSINMEHKKQIAKMEKEKIPIEEQIKKLPECAKRQIDGKLWDCSAKLKKCGLKIENVDRYASEFENMKEFNVEKVLIHDHCTIYITKKEFYKMYPAAIADLVRDYYELRKYDCMNIKDYYLNLHYEKEISEILAASNCRAESAQKSPPNSRHRRVQLTRRDVERIRAQSQTALQL